MNGFRAIGPNPKWFRRASHPSKSDIKRWHAKVLPEFGNDFAEGWGIRGETIFRRRTGTRLPLTMPDPVGTLRIDKIFTTHGEECDG